MLRRIIAVIAALVGFGGLGWYFQEELARFTDDLISGASELPTWMWTAAFLGATIIAAFAYRQRLSARLARIFSKLPPAAQARVLKAGQAAAKKAQAARREVTGFIPAIITLSVVTIIVRVNALGLIPWQDLSELYVIPLFATLIVIAYLAAAYFAYEVEKLKYSPWKSPEEGTAIIIKQFEGYSHTIMNMAGKGLGPPETSSWINKDEFDRWYVIPRPDKKSIGERLLGRAWLFKGLHIVGIPVIHQPVEYYMSWISLKLNNTGKDLMKTHYHEKLHYIYTKLSLYGLHVIEMELADGIPYTVVFGIYGEIVNPPRAIMRVGRQGSWLDFVLAEILGDLRSTMRRRSYEEADVQALKPSRPASKKTPAATGSVSLTDELDATRKKFLVKLIRDTGFKTTKIELVEINPLDKFRDLTVEKAQARIRAEVAEISAQGRAKAIIIENAAAATADEKFLRIRGLEVLGKPGVGVSLVARDMQNASLLISGATPAPLPIAPPAPPPSPAPPPAPAPTAPTP